MNYNIASQISIIICTIDYNNRQINVKKILNDIYKQSVEVLEVIIINNYSPRTRAHNVGARQAKGDIIIFFDDDIRLGNKNLIYNMSAPLLEDKNIGASGATVLAPVESNKFQKKCENQLLRIQKKVYSDNTESDLTTHAALAMKRQLYFELGGENEKLYMNDDLLLRFNIKKRGLKTIIAKNSWVYHPLPKDLKTICRKYFKQGIEQAYDYKEAPENIYESPLNEKDNPKKSNFFKQIVRNIKIISKAIIEFKCILLISRLSTGLGFFYAYLFPTKKSTLTNESIIIYDKKNPPNK
jgi:glycosyltransferase involved in cell wall biosynthesis